MLLLTTLIAPAAAAAGADQGSSDVLALAPDWTNFDATGLSTDFPDQPIPQIGALNNDNASQAYTGFTYNNSWYRFSSDLNDTLVFAVGTSTKNVYFVSQVDSSHAWYRRDNSTGSEYTLSSHDDVTGLYYAQGPSVASTWTAVMPVFSALSDGLYAASQYLDSVSGAVLISAGTSYEWCTGYQLTNSGTSPIAGGWYNDSFYVATYTPNYRITNSTVSVNFSLYDNATGLYYSMVQLIGDTSDEIGPQFDSAAAFFASAVEVLDDSSGGGGYGSEVEGVPGTFDLPAGYVGYLHLYDPTVEITLTTTMNRYSSIGGGWNANQTYKSGTTLPYGSRQFPSSGSSVILWNKDASGQTNLLGQTKAARRTFNGSANLIEIYNPYYQDAGGNSEDGNTAQATINNTIHGSTVGIMSWVIYPVEDNMSASNFSGIDSTLPDGTTGNPAINDGNNNWTSFEDSEGNQYIPPEGGLNAPVGGSSITDILNNFFTRFFGLFTEGHDAIRNLTQQASEFVSHLSELYSWLPPQVLSVLTSAIILAIIIGVLKVFL